MATKVMPTSTRPPAITDSPFAGLNFYTEYDSKWFFGRDAERMTIVGNLRATRLTLLYADSGVGKSSLLRAGVASKLLDLARKRRDERGSAQYVPILFSSWKDEPVDALISCILREVREFIPAEAELARGSDQLDEVIKAAAKAADSTLLIILDQFEEYFLYRSNEAHPGRFSEQFARCVNDPDVRANFLISIREDAYSGLGDLFASRINSVYGNYLHLDYLDRASGREAIEGPIGRFNAEHADNEAIEIEPALTNTVLDEVGRGKLTLGPGAQDGARSAEVETEHNGEIEAPFLQLVMRALWSEVEPENGSRVLRKETLERLGGADKIVRTHVENALAQLADYQLETATDVFHELVTPSGTKIAHTVADLANMTHHPADEVAAVVKKLYDARIFRGVEPAPGMNEMRYELFHDRLARPLLDWLEVRDRERLQNEAEAEARNARKFRRRSIAIGVVALVAVGLLILALVFRQNAINETHNAQSVALATRATATSQLDLSSLLALGAYRVKDTVDARGAILDVAGSRELGAPLRGHTGYVYAAAFSPDGTIVASSSADGTIRLWNVATHAQLAKFGGDAGTVYQVAFSPNGKVLASGTANGTVQLWNVATHAEIGGPLGQPVAGDRDPVYSVAFSPNGRMLASGHADGMVRLWDVASRRPERAPLRADHHSVFSVAFSPDGKTLATAGADKRVWLWDVARRRAHGAPLKGSTNTVFSVAFGPDGRTLASGGADNMVRLWNVAARKQVAVLRGQTSTVRSVAFSPNGRTLASGGYDNVIRLWDVGTRRQLGSPLIGHRISVLSVAFSPNGRTLVSGSADDTIRLWNVRVANGRERNSPLTGDTGPVQDVAFSPKNGGTLASGSADGTVRLWDVQRDRQLGPPIREPKIVQSVAFSPNGTQLATGSGDFTIRLWNVATHAEDATFGGHAGTVYQVAFSPNGKVLASGTANGTVQLWNVATHAEIGTPLGHPVAGGREPVESVAFSPNGNMLASGGADSEVRLWNAATGRPLGPPLSGHQSTVTSIAFSRDGSMLASGSTDGTVQLWNLRARQELATLVESNAIEGVAFSPDGTTLAAGSTDGSVQLWDVPSRRQLGLPLTDHTGAIKTVAFSPSGTTIAAAGTDDTIHLWTDDPINVYMRQLCGYIDEAQAPSLWKQGEPSIPFQRPC